MMSPWRRWIALSAFAAIIGIAVWWTLAPTARNVPSGFSVTTLRNQTIDLSNSTSPLLVSFWATTCAVCMKEMPQLVAFQKNNAHLGLRVVAVAMPYDRPLSVMNYAQSRQFDLDYSIDFEGKINRTLGGVTETPTALLIHKGKVIQTIRGEPDWQKLNDIVKQLS
jgi:thiol-disulfide isomerase/thioredoxin